MPDPDGELRHDWLWHVGNAQGAPVVITTCTACGTIRVNQVLAVGLDAHAEISDACPAKNAPTATSESAG